MDNTRKKDAYYTPSVMLEIHPKIANFYNAQELGYLRKLKVVNGKELKRGCLISEASLLDFLQWRFGITDV